MRQFQGEETTHVRQASGECECQRQKDQYCWHFAFEETVAGAKSGQARRTQIKEGLEGQIKMFTPYLKAVGNH